MKKKIVALLLCLSLIAMTVVVVACAPSQPFVDISGNYKASTAEEVNKLLEEKKIDKSVNYAVKVDSNTDGRINNYDAVMFVNENSKIIMSGNVIISSVDENNKQRKTVSSFYLDENFLYITLEGKKVKIPVNESYEFVPTGMLPTGNLTDVYQGIAHVATYEIATDTDVTKAKISVSVEEQVSSDMYFVLNKGEFVGYKMIATTTQPSNISATVEFVPTTKTVKVPTDLDQYKEQ